MSTPQPTLEDLFLAMVESHNERALELRIMYRLLNESGCELPLNFMAPDATYDEIEERQPEADRPFFGLTRKPEAERPVASVIDKPIRAATTEVLSSGIVVTTTALTDNGKVIVGDRRKHERTEGKRDNGDAEDVEVHEESTLSQLRRAAEEGAEPEPTIPADFSLAAATKVTVTPITERSVFFQNLYQLFLRHVSPRLHQEGTGNWDTNGVYNENPLSTPNDIAINWPTGVYRSGNDNLILISIGEKNDALYMFDQSYRTGQDPQKNLVKILLRLANGEIVVIDSRMDKTAVAQFRDTTFAILEAYFTSEDIGKVTLSSLLKVRSASA